jgi:hypothetical protein
MKSFFKVITFFYLIHLTSACNGVANTDDLVDSLGNNFNSLSDSISSQTEGLSESAKIRAKKLFKIEYKLLKFPSEGSLRDIETTLSRMGEERWDCFHIESQEINEDLQTVIYCKRLPIDYMRIATTLF